MQDHHWAVPLAVGPAVKATLSPVASTPRLTPTTLCSLRVLAARALPARTGQDQAQPEASDHSSHVDIEDSEVRWGQWVHQ